MRGSFDPAPLKPESEAGRSRLRFTAYLGLPEPPRFDIKSTRLRGNPPDTLEATVRVPTVQYTLRQVNDINFFHDVFEVELKRTWDLPSSIIERLQGITGGSSDCFANPKPIVLRSIEERARWIFELRDVITLWPSSVAKPLHFNLVPRETDKGFNPQDIMALELAVAKFYCQAAGEILGRRPTIPLYR